MGTWGTGLRGAAFEGHLAGKAFAPTGRPCAGEVAKAGRRAGGSARARWQRLSSALPARVGPDHCRLVAPGFARADGVFGRASSRLRRGDFASRVGPCPPARRAHCASAGLLRNRVLLPPGNLVDFPPDSPDTRRLLRRSSSGRKRGPGYVRQGPHVRGRAGARRERPCGASRRNRRRPAAGPHPSDSESSRLPGPAEANGGCVCGSVSPSRRACCCHVCRWSFAHGGRGRAPRRGGRVRRSYTGLYRGRCHQTVTAEFCR
jgi:hypothetical protein